MIVQNNDNNNTNDNNHYTQFFCLRVAAWRSFERYQIWNEAQLGHRAGHRWVVGTDFMT